MHLPGIEEIVSVAKWPGYVHKLEEEYGYSKEDIKAATEYLTNPDNFPPLSVGIDGEAMDPEKLNFHKDGEHPNMSAYWKGEIRITRHWVKRYLENEPDMQLALQAQMAHEHCHHLYDYPTSFIWEVTHQNDKILSNWINECRNDTMGCMRAFNGDPDLTHRSLEFLKTHASPSGRRHDVSHPSWEFRQKIAERGTFDEESIRMITEEARKYAKKRSFFHIFFKEFSHEFAQTLSNHAKSFAHEDLSFCHKKEEKIEKEREVKEPALTIKKDMSVQRVKEIVHEKRTEREAAVSSRKMERKKENQR